MLFTAGSLLSVLHSCVMLELVLHTKQSWEVPHMQESKSLTDAERSFIDTLKQVSQPAA